MNVHVVARRIAALFLVSASVLLPASASAHVPGWALRGYGTPLIDGIVANGEWDGAAKVDFAANRLAEEGGGTAPASLFVMNDGANLYAAVKVARPSLGSSSISFDFDNEHDGPLDNGDDAVVVNAGGLPVFYDDFYTAEPPCPATLCGFLDTDVGGTNDGSAAATNNGQFSFYELSHPLDSADDGHDISVHVGNRVGFLFSLRFCGHVAPCSDTILPPGGYGDIVVTSRNSVPPDTAITGGPEDGGWSNEPAALFAFTGADDVIAAADLEYECSLDAVVFSTCVNPTRLAPLGEGPHTFAVRAADEALNWDPTPAVRHWRVDMHAPDTVLATTPPPIARIASARLSFSGTDNLAAASELSFQCSLDDHGPSPCQSPATLTVPREGKHRVTVAAVDRAGNIDQSPAEHQWTVDLRPPTRPLVRGPRTTANRRPAYTFSSTDSITARAQLRFRCAFDSLSLHPCNRSYRQRLAAGNHILRVLALDAVGRRSPTARLTILILSER